MDFKTKALTKRDKEQLLDYILQDRDFLSQLYQKLNISSGGSNLGPSIAYVKSVTAGSNATVDNTDPQNPIVSSTQRFVQFIYNSSGSQTYPAGNRFNSWSSLMSHVADLEGPKLIIFEQDETIPAGSYNLDGVTLQGNNGLEYNSGGWTATFGDNTTISSWIGCKIDGIRILSTSTTGNICTFSSPSLISNNNVSNVHSTTYPFFKFTGSGQMIVLLNNSARWRKLSGGVENLDVTSSAFACQLIVARGKGTTIENNTLKSTNAVIYIDVLQDAGQDPTTFSLTNTGLTVGFLVEVNSVYATTLNHIPVTKNANWNFTRAAEAYAGNANGGAITGTLPAATGSGLLYSVIKVDNSVNTVTAAASGADVIDSTVAFGAATYVLALQGNGVTMIDFSPGHWLVVGLC